MHKANLSGTVNYWGVEEMALELWSEEIRKDDVL